MNNRIVIPPREPKPILGRKPEFDFRSIKPGEVKRFDCTLSIVRPKLYTFTLNRRTFDTWFYDVYETIGRNGETITMIYRAHDMEDMERVKGMEGRARYDFFTDYHSRMGEVNTLENLKARYNAEGKEWPLDRL